MIILIQCGIITKANKKRKTAYLLIAKNRKKVKGSALALLVKPLSFFYVLRKQNGEAFVPEPLADERSERCVGYRARVYRARERKYHERKRDGNGKGTSMANIKSLIGCFWKMSLDQRTPGSYRQKVDNSKPGRFRTTEVTALPERPKRGLAVRQEQRFFATVGAKTGKAGG